MKKLSLLALLVAVSFPAFAEASVRSRLRNLFHRRSGCQAATQHACPAVQATSGGCHGNCR